MKTKIHFLSILFLFVFTGNSQNKSDNFDFGHVNNSTYTNPFFDCELTLPQNWIIQTKEEIEAISNKGKELIAGDDSNLKAIIKSSQVNSANLLSVFEFERGSPVDYNSSISVIVENIKNLPGIKSGSDYLFQARKMLVLSQVKYDYIEKDFKKEFINDTEFYRMDAEINIMGINIKQSYYSTIVNGFSFNLISSYSTEEQKNVLLKSINSLTFKK